MNKTIRSTAKKIIPKPILLRGWETYCRFKARHARQKFEQAKKEPEWLGWDELDALQNSYQLPVFDYTYEQDTLEERARERLNTILKKVPTSDRSRLTKFLDLGAWDGTNCQMLQEMGKTAVGIDIRAEGFTEQAKASGAFFQQADIDFLPFADNSFDFIFSYNSFEHFPNPDLALKEAIRVARPGGYIYLNFGPLWFAPKGAHQFKTVSVPYNQCLFTKELLTEYAQSKNFELMGFFWMNEWPAKRYRKLWQDVAPQVETVFYHEELSAEGVELIEKYPSCFKSKSDQFDDFLVSYIELMFKKKG